MARETKVGLLVGLGFIVCFAVILENRGREDRVAPVLPHELLANARLELAPSPADVEDRVRRSIATPPTMPVPHDPSEAKVTTVAFTPQGERFVANRSASDDSASKASTLRDERATPDAGGQASGFSLQVFKGVYDDDNTDTGKSLDETQTDDVRNLHKAPGQETEEPDARVAFARNFERPNVLTAKQPAQTKEDSQHPSAQIAPPAERAPAEFVRSHTVAPGDSLSRIAQSYYGSRAKHVIDEVFKANSDKLKSPDSLIVGQRLVLPAIEGRQFASAAPETSPKPAPERAVEIPKTATQTPPAEKASTPRATNRDETKGRYYQVQPGDRYATIARDKLGDASRWKEIAELNRDIFPDPQRIRYGVRIRLPQDESPSSAGSQS